MRTANKVLVELAAVLASGCAGSGDGNSEEDFDAFVCVIFGVFPCLFEVAEPAPTGSFRLDGIGVHLPGQPGLALNPGISALWTSTAYTLGASALYGEREYGAADPLFGAVREDARARLELTLGNRNWRWRCWQLALLASLEENRSRIEFFSYRKASLSVAVE